MIVPQVPLPEEVPPYRWLITVGGEPHVACVDAEDARTAALEAWQNTDEIVKIETIH